MGVRVGWAQYMGTEDPRIASLITSLRQGVFWGVWQSAPLVE